VLSGDDALELGELLKKAAAGGVAPGRGGAARPSGYVSASDDLTIESLRHGGNWRRPKGASLPARRNLIQVVRSLLLRSTASKSLSRADGSDSELSSARFFPSCVEERRPHYRGRLRPSDELLPGLSEVPAT